MNNQIGTDPALLRLDDLLHRPHLWEDEQTELFHLAGLYGAKVRLEKVSLQTRQVIAVLDAPESKPKMPKHPRRNTF